MSGHNKWSKIKHKKAVTDAQKSKVFSKLVKVLKVEARLAGGDKNAPGLKTAIEKAKAANMPKDNIDRAIKSATESGSSEEKVLFEAYGPGGVALLIEGVTDNINRTAQEIKHLLSQHGVTLAEPGAAQWAFSKGDSGWDAQSTVSLSSEDAGKLTRLIEVLDAHDAIQDIFVNAQ